MNRSVLAVSTLVLTALAGVAIGWAPQQGQQPAGRPSEQPSAAASAGSFSVDPVHSSLLFKIKHNDVAWFYGRFTDFKGSFAMGPDAGAVQLTVNTESIDTGAKKRDDHLRSQDFFSATEFPTITFSSNSVKKTGENTYEATGDFTLHGVTKQITVPIEQTGKAKGPRGGELAGMQSMFTIKRSDYGMEFMQGKGLGDEVTIIASFEGRSAK
jgi:polyisoprenoid-binding protein YceI